MKNDGNINLNTKMIPMGINSYDVDISDLQGYEKTIEFDFGTTIHYSVTYPYFRTADKALTKKVNAAVKEAVVKGPVADYKNSKKSI